VEPYIYARYSIKYRDNRIWIYTSIGLSYDISRQSSGVSLSPFQLLCGNHVTAVYGVRMTTPLGNVAIVVQIACFFPALEAYSFPALTFVITLHDNL
jgi:hypothetical protein